MMKHLILSFFIIALISTSPLSLNAGQKVTKQSWINSMSTALPAYFCQANQYFRQCFNIQQIQCEEVALSATRICLEKYSDKIPNILNQPKDGEHWGSIIGSCVGESYQILLLKKRINSNKCNDPTNWQ